MSFYKPYTSTVPDTGGEHVGIAFALVIGAGLSTSLGAAVVFFPSLVRLASRQTLAAALGLSAGVMTYISFVEIFQKSVKMFEESHYDDGNAYLYATLCFFAGVAFMNALGFIVHNLLNSHGPSAGQAQTGQADEEHGSVKGKGETGDESVSSIADDQFGTPPCCQADPGAHLDNIQRMAANHADGSAEGEDDESEETDGMDDVEEKKKLISMSLNTAFAIALHNFPEGLATFIAALHDPSIGAVLAVAIAIHNIPEGLCVAMPVYYGTGSRMRAFLWALFSGISEPIAAIFGYLVIRNSFSPQLYGALFGIVSGMMVMISIKELLPTAHRYDPNDTVVTNLYIVGMSVIALSLCLFNMHS